LRFCVRADDAVLLLVEAALSSHALRTAPTAMAHTMAGAAKDCTMNMRGARSCVSSIERATM
jgi:hypothetical protein